MRVTVSAVGVDDLIDLFNNTWGLTLPERVAPRLAARGYQVIDSTIYESYGFGLLSDAVPYRIDLVLEPTGGAPSDRASVRSAVIDTLTASIGAAPIAVAVTSAGDPVPTAPAGGILDDVGAAASSVVKGVNLLTWAVTIGAVVLVYVLVTDPSKGAKIARAVRL